MSFPRSHRRAAAVVCAAGIAGALLSAPVAWASSGGAPASATPDGLLGTTTTTAPPPPSTTTPTPITTAPTTTAPTTTTTVPGKSTGGVPNVPVAGPPTTTPAPGQPPPPPPDPAPILTAIDSDLSQLAAIQAYPQAVTAVANGQQSVTLAAAGVQTALGGQAQAQAAQRAAESHVGVAQQRVKNLAIAAYMGLGYATPAGEAAAGDTVSTPGGLTGTELADADEMLTLVAEHDRANLADTRKQLGQAEKATKAAGKVVAQARANLVSAQTALQTQQQALATLTKAATTPGAASDLGLTTTATGGGPGLSGSGLAALAATSTTVAAETSATSAPNPTSPNILGPPILTGNEMAAWFATTAKKPNITVPMAQLAQDYQSAGQATGVRDDVAFAQSVVETGFFAFPSYGQLTPKDNNFAGIGACDGCAHGWTFKDAATGVSAQMQLLQAYASTQQVPTPLVGNVGIGGCCQTWMALAGKWASSGLYGIEIMTIYHQMLTWVIPQRLISAGLLAPPPAAAKGPTLAQLPGSTTTTTTAPAHH